MLLAAGVQVRSFAKETASCERYGVAQQQVLRWGLKSAHASGARLALRRCLGVLCRDGVPALQCCKCMEALCVQPQSQCQNA